MVAPFPHVCRLVASHQVWFDLHLRLGSALSRRSSGASPRLLPFRGLPRFCGSLRLPSDLWSESRNCMCASAHLCDRTGDLHQLMERREKRAVWVCPLSWAHGSSNLRGRFSSFRVLGISGTQLPALWLRGDSIFAFQLGGRGLVLELSLFTLLWFLATLSPGPCM